MISSIIDGFMKMLMDFLDSIVPIKSILGLLNSISDLAGQIGGLAGAFNLSMVTDITSQITGFTDQFTSILNNPLDFATSFLPANVSNILNGLSDPEKLLGQFLPDEVSGFIDGIKNPTDMIKQFLPPQLAQGFDKIADMTGLGFTGNMGYGFGSSLKEGQGNVLNNLMAKFQDQFPILGPLLAGQAETPEAQQPKLLGEGDTVANHHLYQNRDKQPQYQKASANNNASGGNRSSESGGSITAYGITEEPLKKPKVGDRRTITAYGGITEEQYFNGKEYQPVKKSTETAYGITGKVK